MRKHSHFLTKILEAFLTAYQMPLIKIPMKLHKKSLIYLKLLWSVINVYIDFLLSLGGFQMKVRNNTLPNFIVSQRNLSQVEKHFIKFFCSNYFSFLTCDRVLLKLTSLVCVRLFPSYYPLWQQNKKNGKYFNKYMSTLNPINFNDIVVKYH